MLMLLAGAFAVYAIFLGVGAFVAPRLALRRRDERLRALSAIELGREALRAADAAGMRERFSQASLFDQRAPWTEDSLAKALDELYAILDAEDRRTGETGPGSWVYDWYDFGLASLREILQGRRGSVEPPEPAVHR